MLCGLWIHDELGDHWCPWFFRRLVIEISGLAPSPCGVLIVIVVGLVVAIRAGVGSWVARTSVSSVIISISAPISAGISVLTVDRFNLHARNATYSQKLSTIL